jgi:hypothetical protein
VDYAVTEDDVISGWFGDGTGLVSLAEPVDVLDEVVAAGVVGVEVTLVVGTAVLGSVGVNPLGVTVTVTAHPLVRATVTVVVVVWTAVLVTTAVEVATAVEVVTAVKVARLVCVTVIFVVNGMRDKNVWMVEVTAVMVIVVWKVETSTVVCVVPRVTVLLLPVVPVVAAGTVVVFEYPSLMLQRPYPAMHPAPQC